MMWIIKKWIISKLNSVLKSYKDDVDKAQVVLNLWIGRIQKVLNILQATSDRIADNEISEEDISKTVEDVKSAIQSW